MVNLLIGKNITQTTIKILIFILIIIYIILKLKGKLEKVYKQKKININISKNINKKMIYIFIAVILLVVIISVCAIISNNLKEKERIEKYNNDLLECYRVIKEYSDWSKFKAIIEEHEEDTEFSSEAYQKLYQAIDERIENLKNGKEDEDLLDMLEKIKKENENSLRLENMCISANGYSNINVANSYVKKQEYIQAYDLLDNVISENKGKNQDIVNTATNKRNEIKDKTIEEIIIKAQEKINAQDYSSAKTLLEKYKDLGNQTILDLYKNTIDELNRIEAEKKAQEEAERKAIEKKERFDYEVYCYFNLIAWKDQSLNDNQAFLKCAIKFGITKEEAQQSYHEVDDRGGWWYQDKYPDIFEKYQKQY